MTYDKAEEILTENRRLREEVAQLKFDVHQLEVMLRLKLLSQFSPSSERYISSPLFPGAQKNAQGIQEEESSEIKDHVRRKKKRSIVPDNAPREIVRHDLPESERICPVHGEKLIQGNDRKSLRVEWIPAKIKVIEHQSATYCCPVCDQVVKVAEAPTSPIPGSIATPSLLARSLPTGCRFTGRRLSSRGPGLS